MQKNKIKKRSLRSSKTTKIKKSETQQSSAKSQSALQGRNKKKKEKKKMEGDASTEKESSISINVKFGGTTIPITNLSPESTIKDLKTLLQPLTNVLPRGQKLIFKGKLLVDGMTLRASELTNGSKIMLMASQGLHQGDGPILKQAQTRPIVRENNVGKFAKEKMQVSVDKNRLERWKATGVIALSECNLKVIPDEVWACGTSARVIDFSNNAIREVPSQIGSLNSMQKLNLNANDIMDETISWKGVTSLVYLTVLSLNQNQLTTLPSTLGELTSLRQLHVANNKLTGLPVEIKFLTQLEVLKANNNRISTIPACIGDCNALTEVDLSSNLLSALPDTFGNLRNLKSLHLGNNGLKTLPSTIFSMCLQLTTLDLHNTEITVDLLRQFEGWENFEERRRLKNQKQLDFRVVGSAAFDEGADKN
ncbi:LRR repeats and ubiquitin-like domain-containing protein At2g30105 [Ziziphus jujuba]|uniref:LRR repeats and ubiquitin-like domain-containing protein At2g30105 n=1 Tax=Ziziphus jujuba TaxID=326968 RepID=A0A6P3ZI71_ZIZJJ|nr:LRR repeats and ubiquitin-like domain-containing protein At2g30105 [Ziziphus jujuba]